MAKKIYDIKPPKVAHKVEQVVRQGSVKRTRKRLPEAPRVRKVEKSFPMRRFLVGGGVLLVLLVGVYFFFKLPKATVTIWPQVSDLALQETVSASTTATSVDAAKKVIPARLLQEQKTSSQDFPASGSASNEGKASGIIKVYNKISPSTPLTLKAGTHFLSDGGKYFVTLDKIVVPAMQGKTAGSISVRVQAEESGTDYNIGPSKFSVPKLSGTAYYYSIWGESTAAMAGGYTGKVKNVTSDDIQNASDTLTKKMLSDAEATLRAKLSSDDILLDGALTKTIVSTSSSVKVGVVADTFTETASVTISALVFKKQDLADFVKQDVTAHLAAGTTYLQDKLAIDYAVNSIDPQLKTESLQVKIGAKTYASIDTLALLDVLAGKSADQIKQAIGQQCGNGVTNIDVKFWPFWVHTAPKNENRISIGLKFD